MNPFRVYRSISHCLKSVLCTARLLNGFHGTPYRRFRRKQIKGIKIPLTSDELKKIRNSEIANKITDIAPHAIKLVRHDGLASHAD
jgi:hypothetical protein